MVDIVLAVVLGLACLVGVIFIVRRLWLTGTNPQVAYQLGRKARRLVETAAFKTGKLSGAVASSGAVVGKKFREGRDSASNRAEDGPDHER